jgi:hypothetical protein
MTKFAARNSLSAAVQITQAGANYVGKAGWVFCAVLGRLYDAHMERAQMRLAPTRAHCVQRL